MDVAASLFVERGYEATSLRLLAERVGMKAGSLYYHFTSKDELLTAILEQGIEVMQSAFDVAEQETAESEAGQRIRVHVRAHMAALFEHGPYTAVHVVTFRNASSAVRQAVLPVRDAYEARWSDLLSSMQADGEVEADVDVNLARLALFGAMNSSLDWFDAERGGLDRVAGAIAQQFWSGVSS